MCEMSWGELCVCDELYDAMICVELSYVWDELCEMSGAM